MDQDQYRLRTGISHGRIESGDLGTFHISDSELLVDDYHTASELVDRYTTVGWSDGDPGAPADDGENSDDTDDTEDEPADEQEHTEADAGIQPIPGDSASGATAVDEDEDADADADADADTADADVDVDVNDSGGDEPEDAEAESDADGDICGTIMSSGEECDRPADDCPYHD